MSSSAPKGLRFDEVIMWVDFEDGRVLGVPLDWYPRLLRATPEQRLAYEISDAVPGLHWDEIDEDISIPGLLAGRWDNTVLGREHRAAKAAAGIQGAALVAAE